MCLLCDNMTVTNMDCPTHSTSPGLLSMTSPTHSQSKVRSYVFPQILWIGEKIAIVIGNKETDVSFLSLIQTILYHSKRTFVNLDIFLHNVIYFQSFRIPLSSFISKKTKKNFLTIFRRNDEIRSNLFFTKTVFLQAVLRLNSYM